LDFKFLFQFIFFISILTESSGQPILLQRKNKKVPVPNTHVSRAHVGIISGKDTIRYNADLVSGWELVAANRDSLTISRPLQWRDSFIVSSGFRFPEGYVYWSEKRIAGKRIIRLLKVNTTESRTIAWRDIIELNYPTYTGNGAGCMGCILIPVYNIGFIIWAHQRWQPKRMRMSEWKLVEIVSIPHLNSLMISVPASKKQPRP
jgi:hypothetical protein